MNQDEKAVTDPTDAEWTAMVDFNGAWERLQAAVERYGARVARSGAEFLCNDSGAGLARWEHVSARAYRYDGRQSRTPTWAEMCYVKRLCWDAEDVVMQLHPRESEYVNNHPHVLHLWRPLEAVIPEPPSLYVGVKDTVGSSQ